MLTDYEEDAHFCIKCHITIFGLDNYINHRKEGCSKSIDPPKSPLPSQLLPPDESFNLKADDFFSSLELRSSSKKSEGQSTSGKTFSGILTRSKTTAVIQASSTQTKDHSEPQQSKSGKNAWIGGHQLKELDEGDNQSKLIRAVNNLERRKEELPKFFDDSDDEFEEYDFDDEDSSSDDQDCPPRHHTGGKWKPSSPIQWSKNTETRDWNYPPPNFTGGKWKPKRPPSPPPTHTKGKWKPTFSQKEDYNVPPPTFTGSKWVSKKPEEIETPTSLLPSGKLLTSTHTKGKVKHKGEEEQYASGGKGKWKPVENIDEDVPPQNYTKGKWKPRSDADNYTSTNIKGKWKPKIEIEDDCPPPNYTKGKWKPRHENEDDFPPPNYTKGKWKPRHDNEDDFPPPNYTKGKWKPKTPTEINENVKIELDKSENLEQTFSKGRWLNVKSVIAEDKWMPSTSDNKSKKSDTSMFRKSSGSVQYWCSPCNRRLASKIVYERHLKSELHFKRTSRDQEFDDTDELSLINQSRRTKLIPPENIFSNQDSDSKKKRKRKKLYEKCEVCHSKVKKYMVGKHLISHYHCRKGDIKSDMAKNMVLENIHGIVLESPFQCSICKFYCNTHEDFLRHWLSLEHENRKAPGHFSCSLCNYQSTDTKNMYQHLISDEHKEVISVINRSVPIVIKKINPSRCLTCGQEFLLNVQLIDHCKKFDHDVSQIKKFTNEYVCNICGLGLLSNETLRRHKSTVHKEKYYICTVCDLKFDTKSDAKLHRSTIEHRYSKIMKSKENCVKKCQYCGAEFENYILLKQHLSSIHPQHVIRCPHCGTSFILPQELTTHLRLKQCKFQKPLETTEGALQCERCPYFTNSVAELIFHLALHEEPLLVFQDNNESKIILKYKCPVCEKLYSKNSLQGHIRQHTHERPFECQTCGKTFARKNNLKFHEKNHFKPNKYKAPNKTFLCYMCGANFKRRSILHQHMQIHVGKSCKCPYPGCIFAARKISEIKEHYKIHSIEKNYSCDKCDYKGKTKQHLTRHMMVHNDTKKFKCPQCSFTTKNGQHLRRHIRTHTGAKPYSCPHCSYKCSNLENLRKHVLSTRKHQGKYIYECRVCPDDQVIFKSNFAKEYKVHLVTVHKDMFRNSTEAASYIAGLYDLQNDTTHVFKQPQEHNDIDQLSSNEDNNENILILKTDDDPIVCQPDMPSLSKDTFIIENLQESWNLVGRYDVEETSGTLIPFESDSESIFQEHF